MSPTKANARAADPGAANSCEKCSQNTPDCARKQLDCHALRDLIAAAGEPGHATPGEVAKGLAAILAARWDRSERLVITGAGLLSLDHEDRHELADTALSGPSLSETIENRRKAMLARWQRERGAGHG